ncbi:MAG TPA: Holliday junction resolvase-like protein [Candidatus Nanoarchaeia archaeon]|nr:Holliday junction resolvase-like protein [Candidatus Nanoarchaeia archaeon]
MEFITIILVLFILILGIFLGYIIGNKITTLRRDRYWELQIPDYRKDAVTKSRAVLSGQFSEQIAPYLPGFPFLPTEVRFLGKPVDFIAFKGIDKKEIDEVVFVEVKTGKSNLSGVEKSLKEAIRKKKVRFEEYRVDENLTKEKEEE